MSLAPAERAPVRVGQFRLPDAVDQRLRALLRQERETVRPAPLPEDLHPARRAVRERRQRTDVPARRRTRDRAGAHRRIGGGREETALHIPLGIRHPPGGGQPGDAVVQDGRHRAVRPLDQQRRVGQHQVLHRLRVPARHHHRRLRSEPARQVAGLPMGVGRTGDGGRQTFRQGHLTARGGEFQQRPAQSRREPRNPVRTPRLPGRRRRHPVQQHQDSALPAGGQGDGREILVRTARIPWLGGEFDAHAPSVPDARISLPVDAHPSGVLGG